MRAWLRLIRLPNVPTAIADVLAGAALARLPLWSPRVLTIALGSGALYAGGIVLNDVFDLEKDRRLHPDRPLPSGVIAPHPARAVGFVLLCLGVASGGVAGIPGLVLAAALAGLILTYDLLPDGAGFIAVLALASCRALNLARGLELGEARDAIDLAWPLLHGALLGMVTIVSQTEDRTASAMRARVAIGLMPALYLAPAAAALVRGHGATAAALAVALLGLATYVSRPAFATPSRLGAVVPRAVLTLALVDAAYAIASRDWVGGAGIAALLPVTLALKRALSQRGS